MNEEQLVKRQIDDLSKVEISTDLIDQIELPQLSKKAKDIVSELNKSKKGINEVLNQKWYDVHKRIGGQNDKRLANAEKAVVDATKFNVGLSCLLVLFSKALKNQQDKIVEQQVIIKNQQDDILKLQGLTKEQADKIVELLSADEYLHKQLKNVKDDIIRTMDENTTQIKRENEEYGKKLSDDQNSKREELIRTMDERFEKTISKIEESNEVHGSELLKMTNKQNKNNSLVWVSLFLLTIANILLWFFK